MMTRISHSEVRTVAEQVCEFCGRGFKTNHGLKIHCVKMHAFEMDMQKLGFELVEKHEDCDCMECLPWTF